MWDHANRFFNRFDQEDLVSELAVYCLMAGVMAIALNVRFCFYMDVFPTATDNDSTCIYLYMRGGIPQTRGLPDGLRLEIASLMVSDWRLPP